MTEAPVPDEKRMRLRYAGTYRVCAVELPKGVDAVYEESTKTVRCVVCTESAPAPESVLNETVRRARI